MMHRLFPAKAERNRIADVEGSPVFTLSVGVLSASGGQENHEIRATFPAARKWEPLDSVLLTNRATEEIEVHINGHLYMVLPPNSTSKITKEPIWNIKFVNNDGAATATSSGEIRAVFQREPLSVDEIARRQYV